MPEVTWTAIKAYDSSDFLSVSDFISSLTTNEHKQMVFARICFQLEVWFKQTSRSYGVICLPCSYDLTDAVCCPYACAWHLHDWYAVLQIAEIAPKTMGSICLRSRLDALLVLAQGLLYRHDHWMSSFG